jgi:hypothetical protein
VQAQSMPPRVPPRGADPPLVVQFAVIQVAEPLSASRGRPRSCLQRSSGRWRDMPLSTASRARTGSRSGPTFPAAVRDDTPEVARAFADQERRVQRAAKAPRSRLSFSKGRTNAVGSRHGGVPFLRLDAVGRLYCAQLLPVSPYRLALPLRVVRIVGERVEKAFSRGALPACRSAPCKTWTPRQAQVPVSLADSLTRLAGA